MLSTPAARALWEQLVQWQPATAADLAVHLRAMPDDWPRRLFDVGRPDAALALPPAAAPSAPAALAVGMPDCRFAEGCHRVEACDPGCAVTSARMYAQLAAVLSAPADRATVIRWCATQVRSMDSEYPCQEAADHLDGLAVEANEAQLTAWPSESKWRVELHDPTADAWMPASAPTFKREAERRLAAAAERAPRWHDGSEVRRRIVRETTTYTVEPAHEAPRPEPRPITPPTEQPVGERRHACACGQPGCEDCDVEDQP